MPGNKNAVKLKDLEVKKEAYRQYCAHLASGYPKESFFLNHPTLSCCYKTIEKYIASEPSDFPPILIEAAKAKRFQFWINEGMKLMKGEYRFGSPVVWQTIMRNMFKDYGWERDDSKQASYTPEQENLIKDLFAQIAKLREEARKKKEL